MKTLYQKSRIGLLIVVTLIAIFFGCQKTENTLTPPPVITVTASVAGRVTDLNDTPMSGASVSAGTSVTTTDANGQFIIKNVQLDKDAGFVTITKPGFFTGSRTLLINANTVNNVKIQLIPKTVSGSFDAASGGNINVTGGGAVNFGSNDVVSASNGAAYTGTVSVSSFYLNPADANFNKYMPGDLRGLNSNNQQNVLQSFGMTLVEMNDANGGKLQMAKGKTATVTIPIPSSLQTGAPSTIPLWYFDDTKGLWKQEGSATKQNNTYVGTVAHFSFWTPGQLDQSVRLAATFKDPAGNILANKLVTLSSTDSTAYGTTNGYTDSTGTVSGLIPANATLVMKIFDQNIEIYSKSIGPFTTDTNLGIITITITPSLTLSGTVVDCNNNAVTTGSVNIFIDGTQWSADVINGNFTITFNRYNNLTPTATIDAMDKTTLLWSPEKVITITSSNQNVGQLIVPCGIISSTDSSYINVSLHGENNSWASTDSLEFARIDSGGNYNTSIWGGSPKFNLTNFIWLQINNDNASPGTYNLSFSATINDSTYVSTNSNGNGLTTTVSEYGAVGGYVTGTASGQVLLGDSTYVPFSCSYRVKRTQ